MEPLKQKLASIHLVRFFKKRLYERRFSGDCFGAFRGVFKDFTEARLSAPRTKPFGFNCPEYTREFSDRRSKIFSFDYPVLFWLRNLLFNQCTIIDLGGHMGTHFYAYEQYLPYPNGMKWIVSDLPEITKAGLELFQKSGKTGLSFTNTLEDAAAADILIAAGSVQYIETPTFSNLLAGLKHKPSHLLINKVPLYQGNQFVTLQNGGSAFTPMYVFNRDEFIKNLRTLGYDLVDSWKVETHPGQIPFHPANSFACHSGMYLKLRDRN